MSDRMLPADPGDVGPLTRDAITSYRRQRHHRAWEREAAGSGSQGAASSDSLLSRPRGAAGSGAAAVESAADRSSRGRAGVRWWVGMVVPRFACPVRAALVRPCPVPCVSRLPPVSFFVQVRTLVISISEGLYPKGS